MKTKPTTEELQQALARLRRAGQDAHHSLCLAEALQRACPGAIAEALSEDIIDDLAEVSLACGLAADTLERVLVGVQSPTAEEKRAHVREIAQTIRESADEVERRLAPAPAAAEVSP